MEDELKMYPTLQDNTSYSIGLQLSEKIKCVLSYFKMIWFNWKLKINPLLNYHTSSVKGHILPSCKLRGISESEGLGFGAPSSPEHWSGLSRRWEPKETNTIKAISILINMKALLFTMSWNNTWLRYSMLHLYYKTEILDTYLAIKEPLPTILQSLFHYYTKVICKNCFFQDKENFILVVLPWNDFYRFCRQTFVKNNNIIFQFWPVLISNHLMLLDIQTTVFYDLPFLIMILMMFPAQQIHVCLFKPCTKYQNTQN